MPEWLWFIIGPSGLVATGFGAWRYHRKCQTIDRAIATENAQIVDAAGKALAPVAGALRDVRERRRRTSVTGQAPATRVPRAGAAELDGAGEAPPTHR